MPDDIEGDGGLGEGRPKILVPGESCWRRARADRVSYLIDASAYFPALASALQRAQRQILIVAWDFYSRLELVGKDHGREKFEGILELIQDLLRERSKLEAHLVLWDPALIYVAQREHFPNVRFGRRTHRRFHFHLDVNFPQGISQHQKIVVIDDAVAFVGGLDLTKRRWDTPEHRPGDPLRRDENGKEYRPFHDVQLCLSGHAARDLGDLARERISIAAGRGVEPPRGGGDAWPTGLEPDLVDVSVGIARTQMQSDWVGARHDTLEVYRRAIRSAERSIYIENQHMTSYRVIRMLCERLIEPEGPEVVIVVPRRVGSWLEHSAMGTQRARMVELLLAADRHSRLRLYYPHMEGLDPKLWIHVHSKLLVVDDAFAMVGSTNLSNRSLAMDTEVDVGFESLGIERVREAVSLLRDRLLAEHLGETPPRIAEAVERGGSLIDGIESLMGGPRTLMKLDPTISKVLNGVVPSGELLLDPEKPLEPEDLVEHLAAIEPPGRRSRPMARTGLLLLGAALLAAAWRYTPIQQYLEPELLVGWTAPLRASALAPLVAVGAFVLGGLVAFPVLVLILATGIAFGPVYGLVYALVGSMLSAALGYFVGKRVGQGGLRRVAGSRVDRVSRALAKRGILTVAAIRLVPLAPFTVVNMAAGASHIRLRDYLVGTFIGMAPGIFLITFFGHGIAQAIGAGQLTWLIAILMIPTILLLLGNWVRRLRASRRRRRRPPIEVGGTGEAKA